MEFTNLKQLPKAKKYLEENGMTVKKDNATLIGGRPAYRVESGTQTWHLADQDLLVFASNNAWLSDEN